MVVIVEKTFLEQLNYCPLEFQKEFRKFYQQLKIVDKPFEIKGIIRDVNDKTFYKLIVDKSRIALKFDGKTLTITGFLFNQFL
jgi:hypothetical protein